MQYHKSSIDICHALIDQGFSLIPVMDNKVPLIEWTEYQKKAMSKSEFSNFYDLEKCKRIGVITGYGGLEVIDVDTKVLKSADEKKEFWKEYLEFLSDNIENFDKKFIIVKTISGGFHILYKTENPKGNVKIARLPKVNNKQPALIESRGAGGYVVMYSDFVQGNSYKDIDFVSQEDIDILWGCSKVYDVIEVNEIKYEPVKKDLKITKDLITPWDDFNNKHTCWDLISSDFSIVKKIKDGRLVIKRNGADSPHSGYIYTSNKMFLFSTSTIYPAETALTPFAILSIQRYNGDIKEAAKDLYSQGYGSRWVNEARNKKIKLQVKTKIDTDDFPIDIFPENIQTYLLNVHNTLNASLDYIGSAFMWVLSLCVGNSIKMKVKSGFVESAALWIAIVGRAGVGKTYNIEAITNPLKKLNEREIELYNIQMEKFKIYRDLPPKEKKTAEEVKEPKKKQFIMNDITMEAFVDYHSSNRIGVGVLKDELSGWLKDLNKYRDGGDLENYLSCWSGSMLNLTRKTSKSGYVPNAYVPIIGGVQPSVLAGMFSEENEENGFVDRWLICYPDVKIQYFNDREMSDVEIDWFETFVQGLYDEIRTKNVEYDKHDNVKSQLLRFDKPAYDEFIKLTNQLVDIENSSDEPAYVHSAISKMKRYLVRFSLLIYVVDKYAKGEPYGLVDIESVKKAFRLCNYYIKMVRKNKFDSKETTQIKKAIKNSKGLDNFDKFCELYEQNKQFNKTKLAEVLGVSRNTIYYYEKQYKNSRKV